jgi:3-phytase
MATSKASHAIVVLLLGVLGEGCHRAASVKPRHITAPVAHDSDDPAIWVNAQHPEQSLIVGTDKHADGALYVFDLQGKVLEDRVARGLERPNNVDVEYGLALGGQSIDIVVCTESDAGRLRVFRLPEMQSVDGAGIEVFAGEAERRAMGIALYKRRRDGAIFAIVSRVVGPREGLIWEYRLLDGGDGHVRGEKVRAFGTWRGAKDPPHNDIEAVAVDEALGFVYYSEERVGIHKYLADPDAPGADRELALFATEGFTADREGIAIYPIGERGGYLLVSDQSADRLVVFERAPGGDPGGAPRWIKNLPLAAREIDGIDCTPTPLGAEFPHGLLVVMSDDRTFQLYAWEDLGLGP